jgi:hypothetical protein
VAEGAADGGGPVAVEGVRRRRDDDRPGCDGPLVRGVDVGTEPGERDLHRSVDLGRLLLVLRHRLAEGQQGVTEQQLGVHHRPVRHREALELSGTERPGVEVEGRGGIAHGEVRGECGVGRHGPILPSR